jgi:hypothetical protein
MKNVWLYEMQYASRAPGENPHFSNVYLNPQPVQKNVKRLFIDNRDRQEGDPFDFLVTFPSPHTNVQSVELKAMCMPKVDGECYILLHVEEFEDSALDATSDAATRALAVVYFDSSLLKPGDVKPIKGQDFYNKVVSLNPALAKLSRMRIRITKHDGTVVTPAMCGGEEHMSLMFELVCGTRNN